MLNKQQIKEMTIEELEVFWEEWKLEYLCDAAVIEAQRIINDYDKGAE